MLLKLANKIKFGFDTASTKSQSETTNSGKWREELWFLKEVVAPSVVHLIATQLKYREQTRGATEAF